MGVLPLQFKKGVTRNTLKLKGNETISLLGLKKQLHPGAEISAIITRENGSQEHINLDCRIDTQNELEYYRHGGILHYVLRTKCL